MISVLLESRFLYTPRAQCLTHVVTSHLAHSFTVVNYWVFKAREFYPVKKVKKILPNDPTVMLDALSLRVCCPPAYNWLWLAGSYNSHSLQNPKHQHWQQAFCARRCLALPRVSLVQTYCVKCTLVVANPVFPGDRINVFILILIILVWCFRTIIIINHIHKGKT